VIEAGTRVGHYEIVAPIGSGGMGEVYRARDVSLDRDVAIKFLPPSLQKDPEALARFQREARIISGLTHPHILTIHEVGKARLPGAWRAAHYMVTEFIDGMTLRERMSGETNAAKLLEYMAPVADALQKAHTAGVAHRDLKPENIMINSDGYAKVLDFGLAKFVSGFADATEGTERFNTQQGIVIGTVGYMSPEQVQGKPLDHRTDIFSFGCILYEVLAGKRPFEAVGLVDTLHLIVHGTAPPLPASVTPELQRIVDRCLAKKPSARYPSMRAVGNALRETTRQWEAVVRPASRRVRAVSSATRIKSLAVMPFENAGNDPEAEYLSDGITETIIQLMSRIGRRLKVMARTTVFALKERNLSPQQLAAELGVTHVVTGRVAHVGSSIVISVELINTKDGTQLWGDRYRTSLTDVFEVHDAIASQIAEELRLKLTTRERKRLAHGQTRKGEAYQQYLKGRYHMNRRTTEGVRLAIGMFEQAVQSDPGYALAHVGLADACALSAARNLGPTTEAYTRAELAAKRAIKLDPMLAEGHASLGFVNFLYRWNWPAADYEFRTAIDLDPNYATAFHWYSAFLANIGRFEESLKAVESALEAEPLSLLFNTHYAEVLWFGGRVDDALVHFHKTIELEHNYFIVQMVMARLLATLKRYPEAQRAIESAIAIAGRYPELLGTLGYIHGLRGDTTNAGLVLEELRQMSASTFVAPMFLGEVYYALGDIENALAHSEAFLRMHGSPVELMASPRFETLRHDPRFDAMLTRIGYPARNTSGEAIPFARTAVL